eukprot:6456902-Amphidinium_carterae.1
MPITLVLVTCTCHSSGVSTVSATHRSRSDTTHGSTQCCNQPRGDVRDQSEDQECDQVCHNNEESEKGQNGLSRSGINATRLNVKDFLPQKFKAWADEVMLFRSLEEPRLTDRLKQVQTICQPITDANVISGYSLDAESERLTSLNKVILHRLLSMTEGEGEMFKHYTQWLQTIQKYETTHNNKINDDIKIALVVNSVIGQLRNHLLLNMNETTSFDDIKKTIADFFQSTY